MERKLREPLSNFGAPPQRERNQNAQSGFIARPQQENRGYYPNTQTRNSQSGYTDFQRPRSQTPYNSYNQYIIDQDREYLNQRQRSQSLPGNYGQSNRYENNRGFPQNQYRGKGYNRGGYVNKNRGFNASNNPNYQNIGGFVRNNRYRGQNLY